MPLTRAGSAEDVEQKANELKRLQDELRRHERELNGRLTACTQRERELESLNTQQQQKQLELQQQQQQLQKQQKQFQQQQQQVLQQSITQPSTPRETPTDEHNFNSTILSQLVNMTSNSVEKLRSIKLPKMLQNEPELLFIQVESIFSNQNIVDEADRTRALVSNADAEVLNCVKHIVMANPRPPNSYTQIKQAIISHFSMSDE